MIKYLFLFRCRMVHGVPSRGSAQRSKPYHPATFQAMIRKIAIINMIGFVLTVPANKNDIFISAPKNAAIPVRHPTINPRPTRTSPQATIYEKGTALGITKFSRNHAYQLATSPSSTSAKAPPIKPFTAAPAFSPVHASLVTLPQPAVIHEYPRYKRKISQIHADVVLVKSHLEIGFSSTITSLPIFPLSTLTIVIILMIFIFTHQHIIAMGDLPSLEEIGFILLFLKYTGKKQ